MIFGLQVAERFASFLIGNTLNFSSDAPCTITDLMTGQVIFHGNAAGAKTFTATINSECLGLYLLEEK